MRKFSLYILLTLLLAVACGKQEKSAVNNKSKKVANDSGLIKIATMPTLDCLPLFIANDRGWLEKEGLKVRLRPFTAHMDIDTALVGGSVDGAFTDIIRTERLQKKGKAKFTYLTSTELQWYLISNKTARLNRLDQFGDKMIAITRFSATDYLTDKAFADVKTTAMFYRVQINDVKVRLGMLINNEMDADWLPEPQATMAVGEGHKVLVKPKRDDLKFGVLAFRTKYANKNKDELEQLAKIYNMACDSLNKRGLQAYTEEIVKYCGADTAVVNHLPKMIFTHKEKPSEKVMQAANSYLK